MLFNSKGYVYCPICGSLFAPSAYLNSIFTDNPRANYLAHLTMHYRHKHINYYNKWVHYHSYYRDYDKFKIVVNNRAKRNILRKCKKFLKEHKFTVRDFAALQHTDAKTLKLARKVLGKGSFSPKKEDKIVTPRLESFN